MQNNVVVSGNAITGTLYNQTDETKALVHDWGAGYFLALKFSDFSEGLTYENVQVGLDPSEGSGLVTLDIDCNGVFKITDKAMQKLKVVQSDGTNTLTQTFDLSGLTLQEPPTNTVSPTSATFDVNTNGANYGDKTFTVTPASTGATIAKFIDDEGDEVPSDSGGTTVWSLDSSELVLTLTKEFLSVVAATVLGDGETETVYTIKLTDDSTVGITITLEDTTGG